MPQSNFCHLRFTIDDLRVDCNSNRKSKFLNRKFLRLRRFRAVDGNVRCADVRAFAFVPFQNYPASDVNRRICAGDDADEKCKCKIIDGAGAAENVKTRGGDEHGAAGDNCTAQSLIERDIDDFAERAAHAEFQIFADSVEHDNFVVDGKADDGQQRCDDGGVELPA